MKLNSGGLKLCAIYIIYAAVVITLAYFTDDPKGRFFLGSLAWAPAGVTFGILRLFPVMYHHPWTNTPYFLFPACLVIVYLIGWAISTANRRLFYPRRSPTKRFVLYLALIPIIAALVTGVLQVVIYGGDPFTLVLQSPGDFLWLAYFKWLVPALTSATADWIFRSGKWPRLGTIAGVGFVSTLLTFYGMFPWIWGWQVLLPGLTGAITALVCCWLLDQLNKERLSNFGPTIHNTAKLSSDGLKQTEA
jgi:hypothetical protein